MEHKIGHNEVSFQLNTLIPSVLKVIEKFLCPICPIKDFISTELYMVPVYISDFNSLLLLLKLFCIRCQTSVCSRYVFNCAFKGETKKE